MLRRGVPFPIAYRAPLRRIYVVHNRGQGEDEFAERGRQGCRRGLHAIAWQHSRSGEDGSVGCGAPERGPKPAPTKAAKAKVKRTGTAVAPLQISSRWEFLRGPGGFREILAFSRRSCLASPTPGSNPRSMQELILPIGFVVLRMLYPQSLLPPDCSIA
jgi:hypothetical protein